MLYFMRILQFDLGAISQVFSQTLQAAGFFLFIHFRCLMAALIRAVSL